MHDGSPTTVELRQRLIQPKLASVTTGSSWLEADGSHRYSHRSSRTRGEALDGAGGGPRRALRAAARPSVRALPRRVSRGHEVVDAARSRSERHGPRAGRAADARGVAVEAPERSLVDRVVDVGRGGRRVPGRHHGVSWTGDG